MKKNFIIILGVLLGFAVFSSCNAERNAPPQNTEDDSVIQAPGETTTDGQVTEKAPNETKDDEPMMDVPSIERYAFSSMEDFELFCKTGSRDVAHYQSPPKENAFPPYEMAEGSFVDIRWLFPGLDKNSITVDHVEIATNRRYSYSGYTNAEHTPFRIDVTYEKEPSDASVDKVIENLNTSIYDQVIRTDYFDPANKAPFTDKLALYVFELNRCMIWYSVYEGNIEGMSIQSGQYVIGLSPCYSDNAAFFTDEALKEISCLFRDGAERVEALGKIVDFTASKK